MQIPGIWLEHFRHYQQKIVQFEGETQVIIGQNASGKTSILEAIAVASTGDSFRAGKIDEMIQFGEELGRIQVKSLEDDGEETTIEVTLTKGEIQGKRTHKRLFAVNGVRRRRKDVVGKIISVVFRPEDLRLVEGSPSRRRTFLDTPLSLVDYQYAHALKQYEQALRRRNKQLEQIRDQGVPIETLQYWNKLLAEHGGYLQEKRQAFLTTFQEVSFPRKYVVHYQPSNISPEELAKRQHKAIAAGHTLIGPHKDDIAVYLSKESEDSAPLTSIPSSTPDYFNVATYGSRGQQRLAVLWLKVCERAWLEAKKQTAPVLLLDDILSELDQEAHQVVYLLMKQGQTILTTADETSLKLITDHFSNSQVIRLQ